jgi:hypothetical protein
MTAASNGSIIALFVELWHYVRLVKLVLFRIIAIDILFNISIKYYYYYYYISI